MTDQSLQSVAEEADLAESSNTPNTLPATIQRFVAELPQLPKHYNPIKALPEKDRGQLLDIILTHYECGASIYDIAAKLGVTNAAIYRQLLKYRTSEWIEVSSARYQAIVERAQQEMKDARDALSVTRAREELANARWMLERLQRRVYGQDQAAVTGNAVQININLRGDAAIVENPL